MIKNKKNRPKHVRPQTVDLLNHIRIVLRVTQQDIADVIGKSRCYVALMLNHYHPMPTKYYQPIDNYLVERERRSNTFKTSKV